MLFYLCIVLQDEVDAKLSVMSGEEEKRSTQDKAVKLDKSVKEPLKSEKIDDCQKSPSRFARFRLYHLCCWFCHRMFVTV